MRTQVSGAGLLDSYAAPVSLLNLILTRTVLRLGPAAQARLEAVETLHRDLEELEDGL